MRIALPTAPQAAPQPYAQGTLNAPSAETGGDGFAQLLAQMLSLSPAESQENSRAAEIAPGLGASTQAFQNARMLVETALEHSRSEVSADTADQALLAPQASEKMMSVRGENCEDVSRSHATISGFGAINFTLGSAITGTGRAIASTHFEPGPQLAVRAPVQPTISTVTANALRPANPVSGDISATITHTPPSTPTQADGGRSSPFSAQLLTTDSGLVLLLRLPKLASAERVDLENNAARLLQGLGLKRHQIVIQEITEGQG